MLRVTVGSSSQAALVGLQENASRLQKLQSQLSSGQQITTPSDDPSGTIQALQLRGQTARNDQYATNATDAIAFMSTSDTTYTQLQNLVQQARTLVVQGLNTGASTGSSNAAIAQQIDALRNSALALANTTYNGQPIFGGTTSNAQAYDSATGAYLGDGVDATGAPSGTLTSAPNGGVVARQVGPSTTVQINQVGPAVFGLDSADATSDPSGASDLFDLLGKISNTLKTVDPTDPALVSQLNDQLKSLDTAVGNISTAQAAEGATYKQVQNAQSVQASTKVALATQLSSVQDIDLPELAVQVSTAQVAYQAALQTTASIQQMSLLNFLQ